MAVALFVGPEPSARVSNLPGRTAYAIAARRRSLALGLGDVPAAPHPITPLRR